ncbi:MAG TPA: hypothetical protein VF591_01695 [Pyrinomonadaceae bacterium]|jgi:hypothetical protein
MSNPLSHVYAWVSLLSLALLCLGGGEAFAQVQAVALEPGLPPRMTVGERATVNVRVTSAVGAAPPSLDAVEWLGAEGFLSIAGKSDKGGGVYSFTFEALKAAGALDVTVRVGGQERRLTVAVVPRIDADTLELNSPDLASGRLNVRHQGEAVVRLSLEGGTPIPPGALKAVSDRASVAAVSLIDSDLVVAGRAPGTARVTINAFDREAQSFDVQVNETVKEIRAGNLTFTNGDAAKPLNGLGVQIVGSNGSVWKDAEGLLDFFSTRPGVVRVSADGKSLEVVDAGEAELQMSAKGDPGRSKAVGVTVLRKAALVKLSTGDVVVLARQPATTVQATVLDAAGRVVPGVAVKFECEGPDCGAVSITEKPDNSAEVRGLSKATAVRVVAKAAGAADVAPGSFLVDVVGGEQITDFRPLQIRLDMVDEQVAKDLFGRKAVDEFYVAKVQLFNKIKKSDKEYFGDSILVYSESLQVRVALEVKCREGDALSDCSGRGGRWVPVTVDMIKREFDGEFSLKPPISGTEVVSGSGDPEQCRIRAPAGFVGLYRPYSFETVAVTHDRRDERSLRSRILTTLGGAISFTSIVTSIAVPGPGSDLPRGLDKSNNILLPGLERLFPSMREVQRQNVLTMVMRQLEEIPFGGSIERKIFFPKGALEGLWPGHRVRISGVSTFDACAQAAVIKKVGQQ